MWEHLDIIIAAAATIAGWLGLRRVDATLEWVRAAARRAFHRAVELSDIDRTTNPVLVERAIRALQDVASETGRKLSPVHMELAREVIEELVGEFATDRLKARIATMAARAGEIAAKVAK